MRVRRLCSPQLLLFLSFLLATLVIATPASVKNQLEKAAETPDEKYIDLGAADELDKARKTDAKKPKKTVKDDSKAEDSTKKVSGEKSTKNTKNAPARPKDEDTSKDAKPGKVSKDLKQAGEKAKSAPKKAPKAAKKPQRNAKADVVEYDESSLGHKGFEMPPLLTMQDFDSVTSKQLSFVEFFSPYCLHCKQLAPTWEATVEEYQAEMKDLKIQMRQVNCIESGDLCEREDVVYYPNLRLYTPAKDKNGKLVPGKLKFVGSFPRSIMRTKENFLKYMKNSVAEYNAGAIDLPSVSKTVSMDELIKIVSGSIDLAVFVGFFPTTDKEWDAHEKSGKNLFPRECVQCLEWKQLWDRLLNLVQSTVRTANFNCRSHPDLCEQIGLKEFSKRGASARPHFAMFLPETAGIVRFDYSGELTIEAMKKFSTRLFENSQYEILTVPKLGDVMELRSNLPAKPLGLYYPLANVVSVVFYYDKNTVTEEDKTILPKLLQYVTDSKFNVHLYTGKVSPKKLYEQQVNDQGKNLVQFINNVVSSSERSFDEPNFLATTLTAKPTILIFKDNSLVTSIYQNLQLEDMKDYAKVEEFVARNQFPLYQELTPELVPSYFNTTYERVKGTQKVVIGFINSEDASATANYLYAMSLMAHEYHHTKKEYFFEKMKQAHKDEYDVSNRLKQRSADSLEMVKDMKREIPRYFDDDDVLFTFIDLAVNKDFARKLGLDINGRSYSPGHAIVVQRDGRYYWDQLVGGQPMNMDPESMSETLRYFLDPALVKVKAQMTTKLVGSPYPKIMRFMDYVHMHGIVGYLVLFAVFGMIHTLRRRKRSARRAGNSTLGAIIGAKAD